MGWILELLLPEHIGLHSDKKVKIFRSYLYLYIGNYGNNSYVER